jgi:hypothetical protein
VRYSIELDLAVLLRVHHRPFELVITSVGRPWLSVALCQIIQADSMVVLDVIGVDEALPVAVAVHKGNTRGASARLHGPPGLEARDRIGGHTFVIELGIHQVPAVGVMPGKVEQIYSREDDEESAEQGDCVDCIGGIETLEENERSAERSRRERNVVEGVDTMEKIFVRTEMLDFS